MVLLLTNSLAHGPVGLAGRRPGADRLRALRPRAAVDRKALSPPLQRPSAAGTDGGELSRPGRGHFGCPPRVAARLELATTEAEESLGDQIWRNLGLRTDGRVDRPELQRGLRGGQTLAVGALRHVGPSGSPPSWTTTCWCVCGPGEAAGGPRNRRPRPRPAGLLAGRSAAGAGGHQGVLAAEPAVGFDRQRPAARRRGLRQAGDHPAGADAAGMDREPDGPRRRLSA